MTCVSIVGNPKATASPHTTSGCTMSLTAQIARLILRPLRMPYSASPIPKAISAIGAAACEIIPSGMSIACGSGQRVSPNREPSRMPATMGLVSTPRTVLAKPLTERLPCLAHSMETVTSVHRISALKIRTSATEGTAASPSAILASGRPSMTLFENTPPSPNTDCAVPSMPKAFQAISRPMKKTIRQPPKKAMSRRASTGGSLEKSLIRRNIIAGMATEKTKRERLSDIATGQPEKRIRP